MRVKVKVKDRVKVKVKVKVKKYEQINMFGYFAIAGFGMQRQQDRRRSGELS